MLKPRSLGFAVVALALVAPLVGCRRQSASPAPEHETAQRETSAAPADPTRLPEDPVAGKLAELQWREHMKEEEDERQLGFDRQHLKEHRAVVQLIAAARARYDRARTETAVEKVRTEMTRRIAELRRRMTVIDHWGVNSRLLQDYEALAVSLVKPYADARIAALRGDARALEEVRATFDQHMKKIADWLDKAAEAEE